MTHPQTVPLKPPIMNNPKLVGKIQSTILSPESPPEYEKGLSNLDYVPKSPVYYPAGYSDVSDQDSLIDLTDEDFEEDHSARSQKSPSQLEKETTLKRPLSRRERQSRTFPQARSLSARRQDRKC